MREKAFIEMVTPEEDKGIHFWKAFRILAPHLFDSLATQKNRRPYYAQIPQKIRKNVMIYLMDKGVVIRTDIDAGNQAKQYKFNNDEYGETIGTILKFKNISLAKQFFIEAEMLDTDGTELGYEGKV